MTKANIRHEAMRGSTDIIFDGFRHLRTGWGYLYVLTTLTQHRKKFIAGYYGPETTIGLITQDLWIGHGEAGAPPPELEQAVRDAWYNLHPESREEGE